MKTRKVNLHNVMTADDCFSDYALDLVARFADLARATQAEFGERCEDFDPDCPVCKAWNVYTVKTTKMICN